MKKLTGLTSREVAERRARGLTNRQDQQTSRSIANILRANVLTPFNGLITALAVATMLANQSPINSLFFVAMLLNIIVGVAQEVKAKIVLDRLAIMVKPNVKVIRDGRNHVVDSEDVVVDDLVVVGLGDQLVADGIIVWASGLEIDESLLTGESDPVAKRADDEVMSGSIVVSGNGVMRVTKVGDQSYSAKLSTEARMFKRVSSELIDATNTIMRWIARILIIVVPILVIGQLHISDGNWRDAIVHTVAAIVGMIPEGLVLLTSMAFLLAVLKLARRKVLVQQLPAVETLARVDTLLLDKTGTITDGKMTLEQVIKLGNEKQRQDLLDSIILTMASRGTSPTNNALRSGMARTGADKLPFQDEIPFNSRRKWSALRIEGAVYVMGAPEIVLDGLAGLEQAQSLADEGYRVLAIARAEQWPDGDQLIGRARPLALLVLSERIRPDAKKTLEFFGRQQVNIKIISGDSPLTVKAVAGRVGLAAKVYDARELPDPDQSPAKFLQLVQQYNAFGRVRPEQKRQIAAALQSAGSVVAMTGDGVNDALALKRADLGIAMSSGSNATKSVAEVVLLDNKFSHLPDVLGEGRRVVANIERVANLFIIKNTYTTILALAVTALGLTYPFLPAQMTVIGALSIGIPAFFLALAPNNRPYRPGFLRRVLSFSLPTGFVIALAMFACYYLLADYRGLAVSVAGTSVSVVTMLIGLAVLILLASPIRGWKLALIMACEGLFLACLLWRPLAQLFSFQLDWSTTPVVIGAAVVAIALIVALRQALRRIMKQ